MADLGYPFQGDIYYEKEASYAAGFSGTQIRISDAVQDVRIDSGDINQVLRSISEPTISDFSKTMVDPTLHVEWIYQPNASGSLASWCCNRTSDCDLASLAFEVVANKCRSTSTYYYLKGCKCKTFTISASQGDNYKCSADFSVATIVVSSSANGTAPSAIETDYAAFNIAGSITWSGATGAYVTNAMSITVNNNITDLYNVGDTQKDAAIPGAKDITGTCDISLDGGGGTHFNEVLSGTDITSVVFNTGCTSGNFGKITLHNGRFDSTSVDINVSGDAMITSVPFTFKEISFSAGT